MSTHKKGDVVRLHHIAGQPTATVLETFRGSGEPWLRLQLQTGGGGFQPGYIGWTTADNARQC